MKALHRVRHGSILLLGSMLMAACDTGGAATPTAVPAPSPTVAPTAAATATSATIPTASNTTPAGGTNKVTKIGLVTDGPVNDKGYLESIWKGVQAAAKDLGAQTEQLQSPDPSQFNATIEKIVSDGANPVVTSGFSLGAATLAAAQKYPDVRFIGTDQFIDINSPAGKLTNYAGLIFEEDKAGYLAGALAAQMSKSNNVGAVLGTDIVPALWRFGEGFRAGAKSIKPDITVQVIYHSDVDVSKTFNDPEWGRATALSMIDKGADVIFGAGGNTSNGTLLACAEQRKAGKSILAIGVDVDQYLTIPDAAPALLSSAQKLVGPGVTKLIENIPAGTFHGGLNVGEVGLAPFHDFESQVPADVKARMQAIDKGLKDGSIKTNVTPAKPAP